MVARAANDSCKGPGRQGTGTLYSPPRSPVQDAAGNLGWTMSSRYCEEKKPLGAQAQKMKSLGLGAVLLKK